MARLARARAAALAVASERDRRNARARDLLRGSEAMAALDERDRALAMRLVMGSVAAAGAVDAAVDAALKSGRGGSARGRGGSRKSRLEPAVREALRLAGFEVLYLGTPTEVAVSQGVELVRSASPYAAGLANAVLHRLAERRAAGDVPSPAPDWLFSQVKDAVGEQAAAAWAGSVLEPAVSSVAINPARAGADEAERLLSEAGCEPAPGPVAGSFVLGRPGRLAPSGLVGRAVVVPCDLASQEVAAACACAPGERMLEVGQGRGTKTLLLMAHALMAGGPCEVVSVEVDPKKSALSARRMAQAGVADHVRCVAQDGRLLAQREDLGCFDLVFVDAPCTGTGTVRRHPEILWGLDETAPSELARLQGQILAASAARVGEGGRLVYATCSLLRAENDAVVEGFLGSPEGAGFELVRSGLTQAKGSDTHFFAELRRKEQ